MPLQLVAAVTEGSEDPLLNDKPLAAAGGDNKLLLCMNPDDFVVSLFFVSLFVSMCNAADKCKLLPLYFCWCLSSNSAVSCKCCGNCAEPTESAQLTAVKVLAPLAAILAGRTGATFVYVFAKQQTSALCTLALFVSLSRSRSLCVSEKRLCLFMLLFGSGKQCLQIFCYLLKKNTLN